MPTELERQRLSYAPHDSRAKARAWFQAGWPDGGWIAHDPGSHLLGLLVLALDDEFGVTVEHIRGDQWFGVGADNHREKLTYWVECDDPMDGIAHIFNTLMEAKHGDVEGS